MIRYSSIPTSSFLTILWLCCYTGTSVAQTPIPALVAFNDPTVQRLIRTNDIPNALAQGSARLTITKGNNNVQISNYNKNSFQLENTGQKRIAAAFIDVTDSIFRDIVFDHNGSGGDNVAKNLSIDTNGTAVGAVSIAKYNEFWLPARDPSSFRANATFDPNQLWNVDNLFVDSTADNSLSSPKAGGGFRGELLLFTGFTTGEKVGFSGDMDPNSIAGITKGTIDSGSNWDVGGVSGSEMINGVVTILFGDGTTASGTIASDGSQSGSVAIIRNDLQDAPGLSVNDISAGGSGTYSSSFAPTVVVQAQPGATVRVSKVEGFDPVASTKLVGSGTITVKSLVTARLLAQYPEFPANNAKNWQHVLVTIPQSGSLDVSNLFTHDSIGNKNPMAFCAVVVNGNNNGEPVSRTTRPVRLIHSSSVSSPSVVPVAAPPVSTPVSTPAPTTAAPIRAVVPVPTPPAPVVSSGGI